MPLHKWFTQNRQKSRKPNLTFQQQIVAVIEALPQNSFVCMLDSHYLPGAGTDYVRLMLTPFTGIVTRTRQPRYEDPNQLARGLSPDECRTIEQELLQFDIWHMDHAEKRVADGFFCVIACATHEKTHFFRILQPEGKHRDLIFYLYSLLPLPHDKIMQPGSD